MKRFPIQCECGLQSQVSAAEAGREMVCQCGRTLQIPAIEELEQASPKRSDPEGKLKRDLEALDEHTLVMTPNTSVQQRMDLDACGRYVAQFHRSIHKFFEENPGRPASVLKIGYALLPDGDLLLDIQANPRPLARWEEQRLTEALKSIPMPRVVEGPVALVAQIIVGNKKKLRAFPEFHKPFAKYETIKGARSLDAMLMRGAGKSWSEPRGWVPQWLALRGRRLYRRLRAWTETPRTVARRLLRRWRPAIDPDEKTLAAARRAPYSILEHWINEYPKSEKLRRIRADRHFADSEWERAIQDLSFLVERHPEDAELLTRRGEAFCNHREVERGLKDFESVLKAEPTFSEALVGRGTVYLELEAWEAAEQDFAQAIKADACQSKHYLLKSFAHLGAQEFSKALVALDECLALDPHHSEAFVRRAFVRQQLGPQGEDVDAWLQQIDDDLTAHLELYTDQPSAWAHRAEVRLRGGETEESIADCERALQIDEDFAWALGIRAVAHRLEERWDMAWHDANRAIELGLQSADVYLTRAMCYHEQGELDEARSDCELAIEMNSDQASAFEFRGVLHLESSDYDEAVSDFTQALELGADPARCFVNRGNAHRLNEDLAAAIVDYGSAIEISPSATPAYLNRALAHEQLEEFELALADASAAIEQEPDSAAALDIRARIWQELEDSDRALEDWDRAIAASPEFAPAYFNRGHLRLRLERTEEARMDFERLVELCPDWPAAHCSLASALVQLGELELAETSFQQAVELDPSSAESVQQQRLLFEANFHRINERFSDAVRLASEALQLDEESKWALDIRGAAHWYDEEFVEAVEDFTRVIELDQDSGHAFAARGQVLAELGEYSEALHDLERAIEMSEDSRSPSARAFPLNGKGLALIGLGRYDEARQAVDRSLELCPDNAWAHYNRGLLFNEQGDARQAAEAFQAAMQCDEPSLTPRKRKRAKAFVDNYSGSQEDGEP